MGRIKPILLLLLAAYAFNSALAAADSTIQLTLQKQIAGTYSGFYIDGFGNIYLSGQNGQVKKFLMM
jgi:hypothetical protein